MYVHNRYTHAYIMAVLDWFCSVFHHKLCHKPHTCRVETQSHANQVLHWALSPKAGWKLEILQETRRSFHDLIASIPTFLTQTQNSKSNTDINILYTLYSISVHILYIYTLHTSSHINQCISRTWIPASQEDSLLSGPLLPWSPSSSRS